MATRSTLRISTPEKTSKVIYCHWDGYPNNMLTLLNTFYCNLAKAQELIDLGALSYLAKKVKPEPNEDHSFDSPAPDVTVAYHRDRNEPLMFHGSNREEYNYMFDGGKWVMC